MRDHDAPLVDTGLVKEYFVQGLASVNKIDAGWAEFGFFRIDGAGQDRVRLLRVKLIMPSAAVGPAFDLCAAILGGETVMSSTGRSMRRLSA